MSRFYQGKNKKFIGKDKGGDFVIAEVENGKIRGFSLYYETELKDGTIVLDNHAWTHDVTIKGDVLKSDMKFDPELEIDLEKATKAEYIAETVSCGECGCCMDSEDQESYRMVNDCEINCLDCVNGEDLLVPLKKPEDIFKAKNIVDLKLKGYKEVETLFCDNSGVGGEHERTLTKNSTILAVKEIMKNNKSKALFVALTGIGQFQVYVTIYTKKESISKKAA